MRGTVCYSSNNSGRLQGQSNESRRLAPHPNEVMDMPIASINPATGETLKSFEALSESDAGGGTQYATAMEVPAMKRIVQIAIRGVITQREIVSSARNFCSWRNRQADTGRKGRHGEHSHAKITAIKHQDSVL